MVRACFEPATGGHAQLEDWLDTACEDMGHPAALDAKVIVQRADRDVACPALDELAHRRLGSGASAQDAVVRGEAPRLSKVRELRPSALVAGLDGARELGESDHRDVQL